MNGRQLIELQINCMELYKIVPIFVTHVMNHAIVESHRLRLGHTPEKI